MRKYYTALILFAFTIIGILMVLAEKNDALSKRVKRAILLSSLLMMTAAGCEYSGSMLDGGASGLRALHMLVKFLELSLAPVIPVIVGNAIYPVRRLRRLVLPLAAHALVEFLSMWLGITFYVDAGNVYWHCSWYWIYSASYCFGFLVMIVQISQFSRRYQSQNKLGLILIMLFVFMGILWQAMDSSVKVVWLAMAIGNILFYAFYCDLLQQIDPVTELLNRRSYDNRIRLENRQVTVLFADVDNFKAVNDRFGHPFGDHCLAEVGAALKDAYGKCGLCYRVGGDEFCVILDRQLDAVEKRNSAFFAQMDRRRLAEPRLPHVSVGYTEFDPERMTIAEATAKADEMMYVFKARSRLVDS